MEQYRKSCFSTTIKNVEGNCILIRDSVQTEIEKLKKQSGKDMSLGGATLAKTFISLGLIDEYHLYIHPILLGDGRRLFPGLQANTNLVLLESKVFDQAVMMLRYAPIRKKQVKEER
ncbi:dihydrofolate reductase family protein [Bacillus sp. JCM 19034]|uniref:dihydrofolate reductase family protein n=1 Tax=Bacillus sp. JCM 19034 TaxID=1481928 RepID=UPI0007801CBB|nr:dihydrofolate reductase family protein [Bacillus sp. JCM 19034]